MKEISLEVGKTYRTADGDEVVTIISRNGGLFIGKLEKTSRLIENPFTLTFYGDGICLGLPHNNLVEEIMERKKLTDDDIKIGQVYILDNYEDNGGDEDYLERRAFIIEYSNGPDSLSDAPWRVAIAGCGAIYRVHSYNLRLCSDTATPDAVPLTEDDRLKKLLLDKISKEKGA